MLQITPIMMGMDVMQALVIIFHLSESEQKKTFDKTSLENKSCLAGLNRSLLLPLKTKRGRIFYKMFFWKICRPKNGFFSVIIG